MHKQVVCDCNYLFLHTLLYCVHQRYKNRVIIDPVATYLILSWSFVAAKSMYNLPLDDLSRGDLYVAELWFGSNCDLALAELSTCWLDPGWIVYWVTWKSFRWFDFSWGWFNSIRTVYWMTWLRLNCLLGDMTLAELSSRWFDFIWTVIWL